MILRQILILIISALVLFFSHRHMSQEYCPTCCSETAVIGKATAGPLLFNWNSAETITNEKFPALKSAILSDGTEGESLEITGHYFADEVNDTEYENLGLARAVAVSELLKVENPDLKFITKSKLVSMQEGAEANTFESMSYAWISNEDSSKERVEIEETGDARILFPFNSSDKIDSPAVDNYLDSIAEKLKANKELKVYIVGYTDSLGEPGPNRRLSERRAKKIRDILKKKGVAHSQIVPSGRGEADAVAPNTSEASRQLNRRVEISIK